jgi:hypothetical protein
MVAGEIYRLSMKVAHADRSRRRAPDLGFHGSADNSLNQPAGLSFFAHHVDADAHWILCETAYGATGGERYLMIGNFLQNNGDSMPVNRALPTYGTGSYLTDNVAVESSVPEPGSYALVGSAPVGLVMIRRRA